MSDIRFETLENGLKVLIEPLPGMASVGVRWLVPAGAAHDSERRQGEAAMLEEYLFRGAGGMSGREHSDALDRVGAQRDSGVGARHIELSASLVGDHLVEALPLLAMMITAPKLDEAQLEAVRSLCLQTVASLRDDPQHDVMLRVRARCLPQPFNRHGYGEIDDLQAITIDDLRSAWRERFAPAGAILGIAGAVEPTAVLARVHELVDGWEGPSHDLSATAPPQRGIAHVEEPTAQVHIAVAHDAPREADEHSMLERLAVGVLSGGMSGRLFTEVREKRSLCYSVNASYSSGRDRGYVTLYAGTTPERAQQTLDVSVGELRRLGEGVSREEFDRAVVGLKSRLVMQGESSSARAAALCRDAFRLGRARTLDEIERAVDAITLEGLNEYLKSREIGPLTVATIGPTALTLP